MHNSIDAVLLHGCRCSVALPPRACVCAEWDGIHPHIVTITYGRHIDICDGYTYVTLSSRYLRVAALRNDVTDTIGVCVAVIDRLAGAVFILSPSVCESSQ